MPTNKIHTQKKNVNKYKHKYFLIGFVNHNVLKFPKLQVIRGKNCLFLSQLYLKEGTGKGVNGRG